MNVIFGIFGLFCAWWLGSTVATDLGLSERYSQPLFGLMVAIGVLYVLGQSAVRRIINNLGSSLKPLVKGATLISAVVLVGRLVINNTGLGHELWQEAGDLMAKRETNAMYAEARKMSRPHSRQMVTIRPSKEYRMGSDGEYNTTGTIYPTGTVWLVDMSTQANDRFFHNGLTLVRVFKAGAPRTRFIFLDMNDLMVAGYREALHNGHTSNEIMLREEPGLREYQLFLGPDEESKYFAVAGRGVRITANETTKNPFYVKHDGEQWQRYSGKSDRDYTRRPGASDGFILRGGPNGNTFKITEITRGRSG